VLGAAGAVAGLRPALARLDARLHVIVQRSRQELSTRAQDPFRGLCVTEADVDELLAASPSATMLDHPSSVPVTESRLQCLAQRYSLSAFEQEALLICLAPDIDLGYERLYAYLQDDVTRRRPTVDLILRLLSSSWQERAALRADLGPAGRLLRHSLLTLSDEAATRWPLLARPLRLDDRIVDYLLGSDTPDYRVAAHCDLVPADTERTLIGAEEASTHVARLLLSENGSSDPSLILYLHAAAGAARVAVVHGACAATGQPALVVDTPALVEAGDVATMLPLIIREAVLQGAVLCLAEFDVLLDGTREALATGGLLRRLLADHPLPVILLGETAWEPATWWPTRRPRRLQLPSWDQAAGLRRWRHHLGRLVSEEDLTDLVARYRLDEPGIAAVAAAARGQTLDQQSGRPDIAAVRSAARLIASPPLRGLAHRIEPSYQWDDIVLAPDGIAQLRELCNRVRHRQTVRQDWGFGRKQLRRGGIVALFAGPPGTGKTMAAEVLAHELELDLYRIDLSAVVSKYIGETEKNLERIFRAADQGDAVLLFDEADAIFGKRSEVRDAHDRYANVETAYLLQRLEVYDGLAILTTNMRGNIDDAFLRRLDGVIEFPLPGEAERLTIWQCSLPADAPRAADVDLGFLARKYKLAGGNIRNIAVAAAFLAAAEGGPITMRHFIGAVRREYQKLGKLVAEGDFEQYYGLLTASVVETPVNGQSSRLGSVK
jgi:hypothetical protein